MNIEPQKEHQWLQKLVGEWTYMVEAVMEPGKPPMRFGGSDKVRPFGGVWVLSESTQTHEGGTSRSLMTLGYDPNKKAFVGTFISEMMTYLWVYEGSLDAGGTTLTLNTVGPNFDAEGKMTQYKDIIELKGDDRVMTSQMLKEDGTWSQVMKMTYQRSK